MTDKAKITIKGELNKMMVDKIRSEITPENSMTWEEARKAYPETNGKKYLTN